MIRGQACSQDKPFKILGTSYILGPLEEIAPFNSQELQFMADRLKRWANPILDAIADPALRDQEEVQLAAIVRSLDGWRLQVAEAAGEVNAVHVYNGRAWKYSVETIFHSVRFAAELKGGVSKVEKVLRLAITLAAPAAMAGTLCRSLQQTADELDQHDSAKIHSNILPSPTTIRRGAFAVDLAMMHLRQQTYCAKTLRYLWSDSSPQAEHDWLWSQVHEIREDLLIVTFEAANPLQVFSTLQVGVVSFPLSLPLPRPHNALPPSYTRQPKSKFSIRSSTSPQPNPSSLYLPHHLPHIPDSPSPSSRYGAGHIWSTASPCGHYLVRSFSLRTLSGPHQTLCGPYLVRSLPLRTLFGPYPAFCGPYLESPGIA